MDTQTVAKARPRVKEDHLEKKDPDDSFRKLMEEDKKESEHATLPSPFELMRPDTQQTLCVEKHDSALHLELVDKLIDRMTFQVDNGIETTTISLGDDSIFPGSDITLTHYDTAPDSFHIAIDCQPQIVETVADHLPQLKKHLETNMPKFRYRIGTPHIKALKN
jgi:hypothetical protein